MQLLSTDEELAAYLQTVPAATQLLGEDARGWHFQHLADGVINSVYAVHSSNGSSLLFKQAPPYVRSVGPSFPLSQVQYTGPSNMLSSTLSPSVCS
jgi:5-methylthioribose kinase